ncbi:MAG: dihydropteroate synthase [Pseudomonadota bacterium]
MRVYYRPVPVSAFEASDAALPLSGGWLFFDKIEVLQRGQTPRIMDAGVARAEMGAETWSRLTSARAPVAGLTLDRPRLMGILNVTPDSFSDGGRFGTRDAALAQARALAGAGTDILDIGGESTRPGAAEVPEADEIARIVPVIEALRGAGLDQVISIDTRKSAVARAALEAGGDIVNDVSGLRFDPALAGLVAETGAPLIVMHSRGTPETMQSMTAYDDALLDVYDALEQAVVDAEARGIPRARVLVDPGIGFAKRDPENLALLRRLSLFHALGCGILLGVSRKGFIGRIAGIDEAASRDPASAALGLWAVMQGVQVLRVHECDMQQHVLSLAAALGGVRGGLIFNE